MLSKSKEASSQPDEGEQEGEQVAQLLGTMHANSSSRHEPELARHPSNEETPAADPPSNEELLRTQSESPKPVWQSIFNSHPNAIFDKSLKSLRRHLPNLRHCHGNGTASVFASCDPFHLDDASVDQLLKLLSLRSIIDLRWGDERRESPGSPLRLRLQQQLECLPAGDDIDHLLQQQQQQQQQDDQQVQPTLYHVDFLRCPQRELEQFLGDCPPHLDSSDIGAFVAAAYKQRSSAQASADVADCLHSGVGAVFRILASPTSRPALLVCPDGVTRCSVISCALRLLARDEQSLMMEEMAEARLKVQQISSSSSSSSSMQQQREAAQSAAQQLMQLLQQNYQQPENYLLACGLSMQQIRQIKTFHDASQPDY